MQIVSTARRLSNLLKSPPVFLHFDPFLLSDLQQNEPSRSSSHQWRHLSGICSPMALDYSIPACSIARASFSSVAVAGEDAAPATGEGVKEVYDKMIESVKVRRTMPPNAWMWSLIENCKDSDDIKLLFDALRRLRIFRLSNLRIYDNYNFNLCQEVARACLRVGALDYAKWTLAIHNIYGLTPSIASAHHILKYAEEHNEVKLMTEIVRLIERNKLPLQPGTADIVFRICYNADDLMLLLKYFKKFSKARVKFRRTSFDTLMRFASKRGDVDCLWQFDKLRMEITKQHTLGSAFSCAKGFLLERKPEEAAAIIQEVHKAFQKPKSKLDFKSEMEDLVNVWPAKVREHQNEACREEFDADLKSDISTLLDNLRNAGLEVDVETNKLSQ